MLKTAVFAMAVLNAACFALLSQHAGVADPRRFDFQFSHEATNDCQEGNYAVGDDDQKEFVINFQECDVKITKFSLSGRGNLDQYVTKFQLEASFNGINYFPVNGGRVYPGNSDCRSKIMTYFYGGLPLKYLKFKPLEYFGALSFNINISYQALDVKDVMPELTSSGASKDNVVLGNDGRAYSRLSLFDRVGGFKSAQKVANTAFASLLRSNNFNNRLKIKNSNKLLNDLAEFLQVLLGGPAEINGHACATSLNGYNIDDASFEFFVAILLQSFKAISACDDSVLDLIRKQIAFNKGAILKH